MTFFSLEGLMDSLEISNLPHKVESIALHIYLYRWYHIPLISYNPLKFISVCLLTYHNLSQLESLHVTTQTSRTNWFKRDYHLSSLC